MPDVPHAERPFPEQRGPVEDSIDRTGLPPYIVTGLLVRLMESHFSSLDRIQIGALQEHIWRAESDENAQTGIVIAVAEGFNVTTANQRPAVLVKRGPFQSSPLGMDASGRATQILNAKSYSGEIYNALWEGSHEIRCVHKTESTAELLGQEVFRTLLDNCGTYMAEFKFSKLYPEAMSPTDQIKDYGQHYCARIRVGWTAAYRWQSRPVGPILRSVNHGTPPVDK